MPQQTISSPGALGALRWATFIAGFLIDCQNCSHLTLDSWKFIKITNDYASSSKFDNVKMLKAQTKLCFNDAHNLYSQVDHDTRQTNESFY